jgi:hypothetical protein
MNTRRPFYRPNGVNVLTSYGVMRLTSLLIVPARRAVVLVPQQRNGRPSRRRSSIGHHVVPRSFASIFLARRADFLARSAIFPLPLIVHAQPLNSPTEKVLRQDPTYLLSINEVFTKFTFAVDQCENLYAIGKNLINKTI